MEKNKKTWVIVAIIAAILIAVYMYNKKKKQEAATKTSSTTTTKDTPGVPGKVIVPSGPIGMSGNNLPIDVDPSASGRAVITPSSLQSPDVWNYAS